MTVVTAVDLPSTVCCCTTPSLSWGGRQPPHFLALVLNPLQWVGMVRSFSLGSWSSGVTTAVHFSAGTSA